MLINIYKLLLASTIFLSAAFSGIGQIKTNSQSIGNYKSHKKTDTGILIETTYGFVEINIFTAGIIEIRADKNTLKANYSYSVILTPQKILFKIDTTDEQIVIQTDSLKLKITKNPVRFTFLTFSDKVINEDDPSFGINWVGNEVTTYKKLQPDEHFSGLGEKTGNIDRRGSGYVNWNSDVPGYLPTQDPLYSTFPFYIGIHKNASYGIFFDNTHKSYFNFGASNDRFSSFGADAGEMDYYFIYGSNIEEIIKNYALLTGKMPLPPIWSLGHQQCRWSYMNDKEVMSIADTYREKEIPIDVIYLDINYMDNYKVFTWHPQRFSQPEKTIDELAALGIKTAVIVDPGIKKEIGYSVYEEGVKNNYFIKYPDGTDYTAAVWPGWCHFPDFTNPDTRKWWGTNFKSLTEKGVAGFWNDMNEIASWGGGMTPSLVELDFEGLGVNYLEAKNIYGMQMAGSTYEGVKSLMNLRPLILTRSGFSGTQRYSAIWTGDNLASDEHMLLGCRLVNSLGISGMPFAGVDIGGFMGETSKELFLRWISIGTFTPFMRMHKAYDYEMTEPWSYGAEAENIAGNYISLRYKLMPYIYSTFFESHDTGIPVNRSLIIKHTYDSNIWQTAYQNQYYFGPSILVAPVESNKSITKVYLPMGNWYDFFTGVKFQGQQEYHIECPLNKLPVFVKESSFIPMQNIIQSTSLNYNDTLFLHIYFGLSKNLFVYYEDNGTNFDYEKGQFIKVTFTFNPDKREITIPALHNTDSKFTSRYKTIVPILHGFENIKTIIINNKKTNVESIEIDIINRYKNNDYRQLNTYSFSQKVFVVNPVSTNQNTIISW